jgi:phosphoribosylanthranilate isomerase
VRELPGGAHAVVTRTPERVHPVFASDADGERVRIKICCISSTDEADIARSAGADLLGLVSAMPSGPGPIAEERIAEIVSWVGTRPPTVLLTSRQDAAGIGAQIRRMQPSVVQLVDEVEAGELERLRVDHPSVALMQVIHVRDASCLEEAKRAEDLVDAILLDSGNPAAAVKELGGTGRVHDWAISRQLCERVRIPVFLAGGLRPENVARAIEMVRPFGVDVCSGVRTDGRLDADKVRRFVAVARATR